MTRRELTVTLNRDNCIADGACAVLCPEVFELGEDDGKARIAAKWRRAKPEKGVVPEKYEECVRAAAEACPVQAISVS